MECEGSLSYAQGPAIEPYCEPGESNRLPIPFKIHSDISLRTMARKSIIETQID
jgi:hypothetical protein